MMWPPVYTYVHQLPVVCLEIYRKKNRAARRRTLFGKGAKKLRGWDGVV